MLSRSLCEAELKGSGRSVVRIKGNKSEGNTKKAKTKHKNVQRLNMASSRFERTLCQSPAGKQLAQVLIGR